MSLVAIEEDLVYEALANRVDALAVLQFEFCVLVFRGLGVSLALIFAITLQFHEACSELHHALIITEPHPYLVLGYLSLLSLQLVLDY